MKWSPGMLRRTGSRLRIAGTWHWLSLVFAAMVLVIAATSQWFFFDEWAFLVPSNDADLLSPHVGHWSTTPILITHALRAVFGVTTYMPYILLSMAAHLAICHLLWRVMLRVGVNSWIATALAFMLALLGAGAENILWAFQIGFMGAMLIGLIVILLVDDEALSRGRWIAVVLLSIWSLTFSGTAIPLLIAAGLVSWNRRGVVKTIVLFAPSAIVYLSWYALFAYGTGPGYGPVNLRQLGVDVPNYVGHTLVDGLDKVLPFEGFGAIAVFCLVVWVVLTLKRWKGQAVAGYALAIAALLQAILTALTRLNLGVEAASSSRYIYALVALILPASGLAFTWFARNRRPVVAALVTLLLFVSAYNAVLLGAEARAQSRLEQSTQQRLYAALAVITQPGADYDAGLRPEPIYAPDVSVGDLRAMHEAGWIKVGSYDTAALLSVRNYLDLHTRSASRGPDTTTCLSLQTGESGSTRDSAAPTLLYAPVKTRVEIFLSTGAVRGDSRSIEIDAGWTEIDSDTGLQLTVTNDKESPDPVDFCGG